MRGKHCLVQKGQSGRGLIEPGARSAHVDALVLLGVATNVTITGKLQVESNCKNLTLTNPFGGLPP